MLGHMYEFLLGPIICAGIWVPPESEAQDWGQVELTRVLLISDGARPSQRTKLAQNPLAAMAEMQTYAVVGLTDRNGQKPDICNYPPDSPFLARCSTIPSLHSTHS